jgi:hypothetical protein
VTICGDPDANFPPGFAAAKKFSQRWNRIAGSSL